MADQDQQKLQEEKPLDEKKQQDPRKFVQYHGTTKEEWATMQANFKAAEAAGHVDTFTFPLRILTKDSVVKM
jgi:hypothetical protein